ncbi:MAG: hypothetical protein AAGJ35_00465 [Myxococcota bacterium]
MSAKFMIFLVLGSVSGGLALLAVIFSMLEILGRRKRLRLLRTLREEATPVSEPPQRALTLASSANLELHSSEFYPAHAQPSPQAQATAPESSTSVPSMKTPPVQRMTPIAGGVEPALSEPGHFRAPTPSAEPVAFPHPDLRDRSMSKILYLDPEFELSEVKRVLRIWQMTPESFDDLLPNQMGRWSCADGTMVELMIGDNGFPFLELTGPMANDLASFLPQDLPIRSDVNAHS